MFLSHKKEFYILALAKIEQQIQIINEQNKPVEDFISLEKISANGTLQPYLIIKEYCSFLCEVDLSPSQRYPVIHQIGILKDKVKDWSLIYKTIDNCYRSLIGLKVIA